LSLSLSHKIPKSAIAVKENIVLIPQIRIIANDDGKDASPVPGWAPHRQGFRRQVKKYKQFAGKDNLKWAIREKEIKAKESNRKRPSLVQRKNED
jgi:hypothetical protein